jgi:biopolymer transport protein ExbD
VPETASADSQSDLLPLEFALTRNALGKPTLYLNDAPITEADIRKMFGGAGKFNKDQSVLLSADRGIVYGDVMKVIDMLKLLGVKKLSLETRHIDQREP